jgi:very-short-patch-repair endonuclease
LALATVVVAVAAAPVGVTTALIAAAAVWVLLIVLQRALPRMLRSRELNGFKFVRQEPIGRYVADFVCRERRLIIEVDGSQHAESKRDAIRDKRLNEHRYRILRFWNTDVIGNLEGVLETILDAVSAETPPHPDPLPASGERESPGR